ncbi:MAG: CDP-glucose 4,6-dehydratase [Cyclobacteriaceae bacterium]
MEVIKTRNDYFSTFKGKKVFLTGHTGFKGSWMLYWLHQLGAEITGYSLAPDSEKSLYNEINGDNLCHSIIADIRDSKKLIECIHQSQPDFIFHLAAQPLVRLSYDIPAETFAVNAIGTANVLDGIKALQKPCTAVMITTDKVYENKEWHYPYRETDRLGGYDPYSASKACAELVISSYRNSFFNTNHYNSHKKSIASARAGNVIGGGDWAKDRIIPDIVRALTDGLPIQVRNPQAVRPWQHVLEPISGYLMLAAKMAEEPIKFSNSWNFGPNAEDNLTVGELAKIATDQWGHGEIITPKLAGQPHEAGLLKLDISKTVNELGWKPMWDAKKSIQMTLDWYKNFTEKKHLVELVELDIKAYLKGV